jgi:hypothetical protein
MLSVWFYFLQQGKSRPLAGLPELNLSKIPLNPSNANVVVTAISGLSTLCFAILVSLIFVACYWYGGERER